MANHKDDFTTHDALAPRHAPRPGERDEAWSRNATTRWNEPTTGAGESDRLEATERENNGYEADSELAHEAHDGGSVRTSYDRRNAPLAGHQTGVGAFGARPEPTRSDNRPRGNERYDGAIVAPSFDRFTRPEIAARYYGQGGEPGVARPTEGADHAHGYYGEPAATEAAPRPSYAGRGPRGYQRSDAAIFEDICEHLTQHHDIDATHAEVRVEGGEVTLDGVVNDRYAKRVAENIAAAVSGVRDVHNRLRIAPPKTPAPGDAGAP